MYKKHFNHPILSISPGLNPHEVMIGGGGGSSKTGVPNLLQLGTIDQDGTLTINNTIKFPQQVSCITSHSAKRKTYAVIGVGPKIILLNKRYSEINSFNTGMEKLLFRSICISPRGNLLVVVDGDDILRLFELPTMKQIGQNPDFKVQRATFYEDENDNLYILCATQSKIQLLKAEPNFELAAESEIFELEPKQIAVLNDFLYFTGVSIQKKCSYVIKLKYDKETGKIETVNSNNPANTIFTQMSVNSNSIILGSSEGDVVFIDKSTLKKKGVSSKVHTLPITSICSIDNYAVTGGIDSVVSVIENKKPSYRKYIIFLFVCILILLISFLYNKMH